MDIDILKPDTGYLSIERPSTIGSSSDRQSSGLGTPDPDINPNAYTEPVSDGEEDEDMDIVPAKNESRRTGLNETEAAEAIAYREKMLKQVAEERILTGKKERPEAKDEDGGDQAVPEGNIDERTPFLRVKPPSTDAPEHPRALSIDPLAPSSTFDQTLRERLRHAKGDGEGESIIEETTVNDDEEDDDREEGSSRGQTRGDDRELVRHFKAPAGKMVAVPVRIEPKVYFAAERTFLVSSLFRIASSRHLADTP